MRVAVSRNAKVRGREEFLSPAHVLLLVKREHGGNKPSGGLPVGADCRGASGAITTGRGVCRARIFASLVRLAFEQELLLNTLQ